ncbi:MAG: polysaccharide biosynthesis C-terminal domain-containing protein, partial [Nanoarchaeota archaeon]|nr:polysaccharide biosynthesis C-terminal domain-containing protein [Nanoarchaeota archaeon]
EKSLKIMRKIIPLLILIGLIGTFLIALILPIAINLVFGQKYQESVFYSLMLLISIVFIPLNGVFSSIIIYHGYKKFYLILTFFINIIQIILFLILIPIFRIWGIIFSIVSLSILTTLLNLIWFYRLPEKNYEKKVLSRDRKRKIKGYGVMSFDGKFNGDNILKIFESDFFNRGEDYPYWSKIIGKLSGAKVI